MFLYFFIFLPKFSFFVIAFFCSFFLSSLWFPLLLHSFLYISASLYTLPVFSSVLSLLNCLPSLFRLHSFTTNFLLVSLSTFARNLFYGYLNNVLPNSFSTWAQGYRMWDRMPGKKFIPLKFI